MREVLVSLCMAVELKTPVTTQVIFVDDKAYLSGHDGGALYRHAGNFASMEEGLTPDTFIARLNAAQSEQEYILGPNIQKDGGNIWLDRDAAQPGLYVRNRFASTN